MSRSLNIFVLGVVAAGLGLAWGCGGSTPPPRSGGARPTQPPPPPPRKVEPPAPPPEESKPASFAKTDPVVARLGLSAEQAGKVDAVAAGYAKQLDALSREDPQLGAKEKALGAEREAKVREALTPEQQPKYDAGRKLAAENAEKVFKLQQETMGEMAAAGKELDKRRVVRDGYQAKRKALDAEFEKALDEAVGKKP